MDFELLSGCSANRTCFRRPLCCLWAKYKYVNENGKKSSSVWQSPGQQNLFTHLTEVSWNKNGFWVPISSKALVMFTHILEAKLSPQRVRSYVIMTTYHKVSQYFTALYGWTVCLFTRIALNSYAFIIVAQKEPKT